MDKDLLRLVIIVAGVVVVLGLVAWSFLKNKRRRQIDFYDRGDPLEQIDESLIVNTKNDDFDIVPLGSALDEGETLDPISAALESVDADNSHKTAETLPELVQFSLVCPDEQGFNALEVGEACHRAGLEFGSMNVFERVDDQRRVDYAVANMVEPGTFPDDDWSSFYCPGIVFYLQPRQLDDPAAVFEDLMQTLDYLATELNGEKWDQQRQALSVEMINHYRNLFVRN